jgi:hypothetical protein
MVISPYRTITVIFPIPQVNRSQILDNNTFVAAAIFRDRRYRYFREKADNNNKNHKAKSSAHVQNLSAFGTFVNVSQPI